ncbi:hypothetical protein C7S16_0410 [Burkholderia thailandensis]|uniref:Lipoprotein n=1 Tax=Burkholderia thailandensis TaxID=57975 RepID=A0AAW9D019_BURTH|nr:hypothetical protein [Burkholderia thailandensis]
MHEKSPYREDTGGTGYIAAATLCSWQPSDSACVAQFPDARIFPAQR